VDVLVERWLDAGHPEDVVEPARVVEQVADGHRRVEPLVREDVGGLVVEAQDPLVHELERERGGEGLGHAGEGEGRVLADRRVAGRVGLAGGPSPEAAARPDDGDGDRRARLRAPAGDRPVEAGVGDGDVWVRTGGEPRGRRRGLGRRRWRD
jgi:hypothetical protein